MPFACAGVGDTSAFPSLMRVLMTLMKGGRVVVCQVLAAVLNQCIAALMLQYVC